MRDSGAGSYLVAASAAGLQITSIVGSLAFLTRSVPPDVVGHFSLCLTIASFAQASDGVRHVAVVMASQNQPDEHHRGLSAWSFFMGLIGAIVVFTVSAAAFRLTGMDALGLAILAGWTICMGAWMGRGEGVRGAHWAVAVQGCAATVATLTAAAAAFLGKLALVGWALLLAPFFAAIVLGLSGFISRPSASAMSKVKPAVLGNTWSHLVTGVSSVVDRVAAWLLAGPVLLGLYAPIAELAARLGSLTAVAAHYFLPAEATRVGKDAGGSPSDHRRVVATLMILACLGAVTIAALAQPIAQALLGRAGKDDVAALRILMVVLVISTGASWAAVILKSRMRFVLYPPYLVSLLICALAASWLVPAAGVTGPALVLLISASAGVFLIYRARREMGSPLIGCLFAGVVASGALALV